MDLFPLDCGPLSPAVGVIGGWRVTSYFGGRVDPLTGRPGNHGGMDLAHASCHDAPIYACCAGRVSQGWDPSGGGWWTNLWGDDGCRWGFGHASRYAQPSLNGRHVRAGEVLAYIGTSGGSTGAHLHVAYARPATSPYRDPHDELVEAARAGRFPGSAPAPPALHEEDIVTPEDHRAVAREVVALLTNERGDGPANNLSQLRLDIAAVPQLTTDLLVNANGDGPEANLSQLRLDVAAVPQRTTDLLVNQNGDGPEANLTQLRLDIAALHE